jgi:hypothetical protein
LRHSENKNHLNWRKISFGFPQMCLRSTTVCLRMPTGFKGQRSLWLEVVIKCSIAVFQIVKLVPWIATQLILLLATIITNLAKSQKAATFTRIYIQVYQPIHYLISIPKNTEVSNLRMWLVVTSMHQTSKRMTVWINRFARITSIIRVRVATRKSIFRYLFHSSHISSSFSPILQLQNY